MKQKIGLLFGGNSTEHQVSLQSAKSVVEAIDKEKYEILLIGIDKEGKWHLYDSLDNGLLNTNNPNLIQLKNSGKRIALIPGEKDHQFLELPSGASLGKIDVIFPLVHGGLGEDGSMQGLLRLANIPFVGPSVLSSAICMDKDITKRILLDAGLRVARYLTFTRNMKDTIAYKDVKKKLGTPIFIKPASQGSSVGVSKVNTEEEFYQGINNAFCYDHKIIIEESIVGREIECAVLGNNEPISSLPGEILTSNTFYSYEAKYIDEKGAQLIIPAVLEEKVIQEIKTKSVEAFKVLHCEGLARVDFFLTQNQELIINEINTLPGFTKQSMYPKLWKVSGLPYKELINKLISLAIERHRRGT
jgi:D-alanine-D-alanine ligase